MTAYTLLIYSYVFLIGAAVGSFANVCIYRLPSRLSVVSPRSRCTRCGIPVRFYDNIPVLSYVLLRGKCRFCSYPFGVRYWLIEILTGILTVAIYRKYGVSFQSVYFYILTVALLVASVIDLDHRIIPDVISIPGFWFGLFIAALATWLQFQWPIDLKQALLGALLGGGLLWGVGKIYEWITGREGIGFGDVKLLALFGVHSGVLGVLTSLFYASALGSMVGLLMILFLGKGRRYPIPFGPFLCAGLLIFALWGEKALTVPMEYVRFR